MLKSNYTFFWSLKRTVIILSFLFVTTSLHAGISWEFELKAKSAVNYLNEQKLYENNQYLDFIEGAGLDITLCFGRYIGLDVFATYFPFCYANPVVAENPWSKQFLVTPGMGFGITVMIPFTDSLKLKTTAGYGFFAYQRYSNGTYLNSDGEEREIYEGFMKTGWQGSVSCVWMPVKHFGLSFGTDFCIDYQNGPERKLPQSKYPYTPKYFQVFVSPYIGGIIKLGRKL